nr:NAD(P)-dependent oxidoreductase [Chelatococcus sp. HY11]
MIGLGSMGGAVGRRLLDRGIALHVFDIDASSIAKFVSRGAIGHVCARDLAHHAEVVLTCLPTTEGSLVARMGQDGIIGGRVAKYVVELSTVGPSAAAEQADLLAKVGIRSIDAPVSGGPHSAENGQLTVMVGGPEANLQAVRPLLEAIGAVVVHVGPNVGDGQRMKLINNLLAASNIANSFEALALGVRMGLTPPAMVDVIGRSSGANTGFSARRIAAVTSRSFEYGGKIALFEKDIALVRSEALALGFPFDSMLALAGVVSRWRVASERGLSDQDLSMLMTVIEDETGVSVIDGAERIPSKTQDS